MRPLRRNPEGTGLAGRSAVSRRSPMGPTIGFAPLRASHPGEPPSRPRETYSEVPKHPLVHGIVLEVPFAFGSRHHVQIIRIVAIGDDHGMIAPRNEHDIVVFD